MQRELPDGYLAGQLHVVAECGLVAIDCYGRLSRTQVEVGGDIAERTVLGKQICGVSFCRYRFFVTIQFYRCSRIVGGYGLAVGADSDVAGDGGRAVFVDGLNRYHVLRTVMDEGNLVLRLPGHVDGSSGVSRCDFGVLGTCARTAARGGDGGAEGHLLPLLGGVIALCSVLTAAGGHHEGQRCCAEYLESLHLIFLFIRFNMF